MRSISTSVLSVFLSLQFAYGCDEEPARPDPSTEQAPVAATEPGPEPEEEEGPEPGELGTHDLSAGDPKWEGWVADGPSTARIMKGGIHGVRIADNAAAGFDLTFEPRHKKLSQYKDGIEEGAAKNEGTTVEFLVDTKDKLEWKRSSEYGTTWSFIHNYEVDGRKVSCANNSAIGLESEALLEQHKKACRTLRKGEVEAASQES